MRPSLHACGMLLLLGAGSVGLAADGGVALESTKQELQQLEKDQKSRVGQGPSASVSVEGPTIQLQTPGSDSPQQWLHEKLKRERKQKEEKDQKNWLVDGVQKLGKEEAAQLDAKDAAKSSATSETTTAVVDTSDPQYLLKLFDEQKSNTAKDSKQAAGKNHVAAPDAFAPFLQEWLGSSPVRGQFFDQFVKPSETTAGGAATPVGSRDFRPAGGSPDPLPAARETAAKPNPYLVELDTPVLKELPNDNPAVTLTPIATLNAEPGRPASAQAPLDPLPEARPAAKGPPPGLTDDKKYFPQLKKF